MHYFTCWFHKGYISKLIFSLKEAVSLQLMLEICKSLRLVLCNGFSQRVEENSKKWMKISISLINSTASKSYIYRKEVRAVLD